MQTQGFNNKNTSHSKKPKNNDPKLVLPHSNTAESAKKENKKKKVQRHRQEQSKQTLATGANITNALKK